MADDNLTPPGLYASSKKELLAASGGANVPRVLALRLGCAGRAGTGGVEGDPANPAGDETPLLRVAVVILRMRNNEREVQ